MADYRDTIRAAGFDPQTKEEWIDVLRRTHGDIEDAKTTLLFIADEEEFAVEAEDIEAVTDEPPTATFQ